MNEHPRLPFELQELIIRQVASDLPNGIEDVQDCTIQPTLSKLSLVCKDWKDVATSLLYSVLHPTGPQFSLFLQTLRHRPSLGKHVLAFTLTDDDATWNLKEMDLFLNLRYFKCTQPYFPSSSVMGRVRPQLREMYVSVDWWRHSTDWKIGHFRDMRELRSLTLTSDPDNPPEFPDSMLDPLYLEEPYFPTNLTSLTIVASPTCFSHEGDALMSLAWFVEVLAPQLKTLAILESFSQPDEEEDRLFLPAWLAAYLAPTLETLHLGGRLALGQFLAPSQPFPRLREIIIGDSEEEDEDPFFPEADEDIIFDLSRSMGEDVAEQKTRFPKLKTVRMTRADFKPQNRDEEEARMVFEACERLLDPGWEVLDGLGVRWEKEWSLFRDSEGEDGDEDSKE